jgi:uncharacterized protein with beta-barrel porin domain
VFLAVSLLGAVPVSAQGLNDVINSVLANTCSGLGGSGGSYTPDLAKICNIGNSFSAGSSAGGTATIEDRVSQFDEERRLRRRLRERRQQAASADTALGRGFSLFATAEYQNLNKDTTRFETGFRQDTAGGTVGGDYAFGDLAIFGGALHYAHEFGNYDGVGGGYDHDKYGASLYGSLTPVAHLFVDATIGYTWVDYGFNRRAAFAAATANSAGSTSGSTEGSEFRVGLNAGYDFLVGPFTFGPRVGVNYRDAVIDGFDESGGTGLELVYDDQHSDSLTTVGGLFGSVAISTGFGVLVPQVTAEYIHEFLNDQRSVGFSFVGDLSRQKFRFQTDRPDRDYFIVGVGTVLVLPGGVSPFINYRELLGHRDRSSHTVTAGLRFAF